MKAFALCIVILFASSIAYTVRGQQLSDSQKLIKTSAFLEEKPLDRDAKGLRAWAITYIAKTDEVSIAVCGGDLSKPLLDKKSKYGAELFAQYTIGMAAFKLAAPENKNDENAAQLAGYQSALKAYEALVQQDPKAKTSGMDDLLAKRDKGQLADLVAAVGCGKK